MNDDYTLLSLPEGPIELCPCCGAEPELWQYISRPDAVASKVVMCTTGDPIGPQDSTNAGCPLYMPPNQHYCATIREAVKFWNEFSKALTALQRKNRWDHAEVLRGKS